MRKQVRRRHDAHVRANDLCAQHSELFDGTPGGQTARAALGAHVAEVDRLLALQKRSIDDGRAATKQCRLSRGALRTAAKAVISVGRVVKLDTPFMDTMQLPGVTTDDDLLAYSRGLLERVSAHTDAFVARGLRPDLLKQFADGIAELEAAREAQATSRRVFTTAFESIRELLDQADDAVDVLETIVLTTPAAPPEVLSGLRIARRVGPRVIPTETKPPQPAPADKAA